ncbi:MAG: MerR family transcriptional regulator [Actinomycetota bacterium]|nr:MerR family transcriptional regulator [Actinomycetota bacterium]
MATALEETSQRPLTIGAVRRRLRDEFPDISISKIRYLEDQGLLAPRRTQGGYRLYTEDDVERLRMILRLQRDEFLPLRVIKQELASPGLKRRTRKRSPDAFLRAREPEIDLRTLCERSGADAAFVRELEEYGLVEPAVADGDRRYPERDVDVVAACARLARYGIEPRNLRSIRNGALSAAGLLEQIAAPALRSRNPDRRLAGIEDLEALAAASQELSQLLFWRALRSLV